MASRSLNGIPHHLLTHPKLDTSTLYEDFHEGVIITNATGQILFYNTTQGNIDDISPDYATGKKITDLYQLCDDSSTTMQCLKMGTPIKNRVIIYRTRRGKIANTISNVYPLVRDTEVLGAISFTKDYQMLTSLLDHPTPKHPNIRKNDTRFTFNDIIGSDETMRESIKVAKLASKSPSPIMLSGETGTGKELFAQSIHNMGPQSEGKFVAVNCAALPENLLEGILFGTSKGAFTGAVDKPGLFEQANGGTLFLDELDSMPLALQAKLLRVIQEKKVRRLGASQEIHLKLKIISTVGQPPSTVIERNMIRQDLFYRMGVVLVMIPPLRYRRGDIPLLTRYFIDTLNIRLAQNVTQVEPDIDELFTQYHWPGNVRELEHVIEGAMNLVNGEPIIRMDHLPPHVRQNFNLAPKVASSPAPAPQSTPEVSGEAYTSYFLRKSFNLVENQCVNEIEIMISALKKTKGNGAQAAKSIGISPQTFHYKLKKYGLDPKQFTR